MTASIRVIRILPDINPVTNAPIEGQDTTVEIEIEAEDSAKLSSEVAKCPYGPEIIDFLHRAKFLSANNPEEDKIVEEAQSKEREEHENEIREDAHKEGSKEMLDKIVTYLTEHGKPKTAESIVADLEKEKASEEKDEEEEKDDDGNGSEHQGSLPI